MSHQGWIAALSDGTWRFEENSIPGEVTSWRKLLNHCEATSVAITYLRLQRNDVLLHTSVINPDGFFQAYEKSRTNTGNERIMQGIGSVKGDLVFITWIDPDNNVFQDVRDLESSRPHCYMKT